MKQFESWMEGAVVKKDLLARLRAGVVAVVFEKKDGTERAMKCTLDMGRVPEEDHPKGTGKPGPENIVKVYDVEKEGWRSFDIDRVMSIDGAKVERPDKKKKKKKNKAKKNARK